MICPNPLEALQDRDIAVHKEPSISMVQFVDWNKTENGFLINFQDIRHFTVRKQEKKKRKRFYFSTNRPSSQQLQHSPESIGHFSPLTQGFENPVSFLTLWKDYLSFSSKAVPTIWTAIYILVRKVSCSSYDLSAVNWNCFALPLFFIKIPPMSLNLRVCDVARSCFWGIHMFY